MGKDHLLYGRNVLAEAIASGARVREIYCANKQAEEFVHTLSKKNQKLSIRPGNLPREVLDREHQGVAFKVEHDFYLNGSPRDWAPYKFIVLCNHLQDVQNLGALSRAAAGFGVDLIVHESRRSVKLNPAAIKVSAGQAFRLKYLEVSNIVPILQSLKQENYTAIGLDAGDHASYIYDWKPTLPLALVVGSEGDGLSKPVMNQVDFCLQVPMREGVESLNASHAASIAMSWVFSKTLTAS